MTIEKGKITFWRVFLVVVLAFGAYATYLRFFKGLGASTNLSDAFPWGLWIGFDALCGIMLTAGGFTLMAAVYVLNLKEYRSIARPALLTAFLGYLLEIAALMFDLGKPYNIWHPIIMWNPRSPMFLVGWCVMLYSTIMFVEFLPIVFERFRLEKARRILRYVMTPLVIIGVTVAFLHQSALGMLYLIVPGKLHALWYSPYLPILFFISAIAAGLAMTIFESTMSSRHFKHALERPLILGLGRGLLIVLTVYGLVRIEDMIYRGVIRQAFVPGYEMSMFWLEIALSIIIPIALLVIPKVRNNPIALYAVSILVVFGFVVNRLNIAVTGMEASAGVRYIPRWSEVAVTLSVVSLGIVAFTLAVKYLPIFHEPESRRKKAEAVLPAGALPAAVR
jgi:Ni/Fe-hydrogenase subunit HybB-like protein